MGTWLEINLIFSLMLWVIKSEGLPAKLIKELLLLDTSIVLVRSVPSMILLVVSEEPINN